MATIQKPSKHTSKGHWHGQTSVHNNSINISLVTALKVCKLLPLGKLSRGPRSLHIISFKCMWTNKYL
jgi:hypothetical protein